MRDAVISWTEVALNTFRQLDPEQQKMMEERLATCDTCSAREGKRCSRKKTTTHAKTGQQVKGCGCILYGKASREANSCPADKW